MSRSFLFVPADSERKLEKAPDAGADALILDLEDSVAAEGKTTARKLAAAFLRAADVAEIWVRINALDSPDAMPDLEAVLPSAPFGIVLPKPAGAGDADRLSAILDGLESHHGIEAGQTRILPIVTEQPAALFRLQEYAAATRRLAGLTWGAEDLSAAVGAARNKDQDGRWLPPYELARSLCLFASAAAELPAFDTVYTDFDDLEGLASYAADARRDGFAGMLAIHPSQVAAINSAFSPAEDELRRAQKIVDLFAANPDAGALGLDGKMIDRPHLIQAKKILDMAGR